VVEATRGIGELARETGLNRQHLYRALSGKGNPRWATTDAILSVLGLKLTIEAKELKTGNR
jgi:probable addiction module antidote protein